MFEFDVKDNLLVDDGVHLDHRYFNVDFVKINGMWYKGVSRWYRSGKEFAEALHPVEMYTPDKEGYTERNPIKLEMLYHVVIKEGANNA